MVGGGELTTMLLNHDLINKMQIAIVPTILSEGLSLFPNKPKESKWKLANNKSFSTGLVLLNYKNNIYLYTKIICEIFIIAKYLFMITLCLSLSDFTNYATIIASVGAVISLIFIYRQIKDFKKQLHNQCYQDRYEMFMEMDKLLIDKPSLKKFISNKGFTEWCSQTKRSDEEIQGTAFVEMVMNMCQVSYYQHKNKLSTSELSWLREVLDNEYIQNYWKGTYKCKYSKDFVIFIQDEYNKKGISIDISN